ncbi:Ppx/GppA phosphatase family protein [Fretibacter rubidus]|uniref:Ppx/GppA phosphatase family protein n=1 Tax=Fretibacter rubidus TaxID=570162 RepID=UPI00352AFFDC
MPDQEASGPANTAPDTSDGSVRKRNNRRSSQGGRGKTYAALDLGTNNCRLLVARPAGDGFRVVDSYSKVVRLGKGLSATGRLSDESMSLAVDAIGVCARKMKSKNVKRWRCVATQACRQASNGEEFLAEVKKQTGISLEVISPRVEARLAVMGCLNLIDMNKDVVLVVDIGGGSTELSWVDVRRLRDPNGTLRVHRPPISAWASLPVGVVTLSEQIPEHDDRATWYEDMKNRVRECIDDAGCATRFTNVFNAGRGHLVGTSGTITSLAGIHLKLPYYQRDKVDGLWMPADAAVTIARDMASRSLKSRASEPSIGADRAKLLVAGCAITDVLCEMWPSKRIRVADRGLREGMLMGLMQQTQKLAPHRGSHNNKPDDEGDNNSKTNSNDG